MLPAEPISDHQPIECELVLHNFNVSVPELVATEPRPMAVPKWDPSKRPEYVCQLQSGESGIALGQIEAGLRDGSIDPVAAARRLHKVIYDVAVRVFGVVNKGKHHLPSGRSPNKWFKHCKPEYQALQQAIRRGDTHAAQQLRKEFKRVQRKWERYFDRKQQERMVDELKHNPRKFWSAFKGRRSSMVHFDVHQLHTYWNKLYGGSGRGALGELGQDMDLLLRNLNRVASASGGYQAAKQLNAPLGAGEIEAALKKLHCGRAPGPDEGQNIYGMLTLSLTSGMAKLSGSMHWFLCCTSYMAFCLQMGSMFGSGPSPRLRLCLRRGMPPL